MRWFMNRYSHYLFPAALGAILLVGAGLRLAVVQHAPPLVVNRDSADFYLAGYTLATSGEFPLPAKRAPLYPLVLAGLTAALGPNLQAVVVAQHLLGIVTVVLAYVLGALAFGRGTGLLAALGAALNGSLLLMEQTIVSENVFLPLLMGSLVVFLLGLRSGTEVGRETRERGDAGTWPLPRLSVSASPRLLFVVAGLLLGLSALARPLAQVVLPLMLLVVLVCRASWRWRLWGTGLLVLGFGVAVGPWMARNQAVHGVAAISSGLGDALFARTHRHDDGFEWRDRGEPPADSRRAEIRRRVFELAAVHEHEVEVRGALQAEFGLSEVEGDAALREAAVQVIRQQPLYWLQGTLGMLGAVWLEFEKPLEIRWDVSTRPRFTRSWPEPIRPLLEAGPRRTERDREAVERLTGLYQDYSFGPLLTVLFLVGTVRCLRSGWSSGAAILPLVVVIQLVLYVALDGPLVRYRYAVQPLISLVAAGGFVWIAARVWTAWRRVSARRPSSQIGLPVLRRSSGESAAETPRVADPVRTP